MHVNQSLLGQVVFKVAAFRLDASAKTRSPLSDRARVSDSLVKHNVINYVMMTQ